MIDKGYLLGERYRIVDTLGEGGMANVYLAEDIILQRKVAVKVLRLDLQKESQLLARFQREALATSELSHPNIVSVLDVGTDDGLPYMVMEYVDGPDLKEYILKNSPLDLHEVIRIMDQILSAMTLAHKHNVIHRDLKPQNILMDKRGNIKIADFGIAVALNQSSITQTNSVMGSVHYMSPEQTRGGMVTKQSDIYSLGIILYELITGTVPFNGDTPVSIALKHAQETIPSIRKKDPEVPQALENVVLRATSKDPRDRYESAQQMKEDLDTSLENERADEKIFVPQHGINNDETIVLPKFKKTTDNDKTAALADDPSNEKSDDGSDHNKLTFWQNVKKHKLWWIFTSLAVVLIVAILGFSLNVRNQNNQATRIPDVTNMTEERARVKLEKAGLELGKVSHRHSDSINAGRVIKTKPNSGNSVSKGKEIDLVISNGAGMVKVPDVTGKNIDVAAKKLEKMGFEVVTETQFSSAVPFDDVISQSVAGGVEVKAKQTTITLIVSKGEQEEKTPPKKQTIKLKDLKNYSLKGAQDYAKDNDLTLQISEKYSDSIEKNMVISMSPEAGTEVEKGSTITIAVSKGPKKKAEAVTTVTKNFTVDYQASNSGEDDERADNQAERAESKGNHIQIYIQDDDHSISNIYRDLYIKRDMNFSIPFTLKNGNGELRVVRDGQTILNEKVTK